MPLHVMSRSQLNCVGLPFQVVLHCSGIPCLFFYVYLAQSGQCLLSKADASFCLILPVPCSRFCQFDILSAYHWSVTQTSLFLNFSIKSCRTMIQLFCTFLLTNKIYCEYSQGLEKFLFLCHDPIYSQNKNNFQKRQHHSCYIFYLSTP